MFCSVDDRNRYLNRTSYRYYRAENENVITRAMQNESDYSLYECYKSFRPDDAAHAMALDDRPSIDYTINIS